jgi:hypothetical protein
MSQFKQIMQDTFAKRREIKKISPAHDEKHCENVALYGGQIAEAISKKSNVDFVKTKEIAEIAGYMHDIVREPKETQPHGPEGAKWLLYGAGFNSEKNDNWLIMPPQFELNFNDAEMIAYAIASHENKLKDVIANSLFDSEKSIKNISTVSVKIADALLEASGYRVVERRAFFVGNERVNNGDLKYLNEMYGEKAPIMAVLGETQIRLYGKNNLNDYPAWLQPVAEELHAIQYRFYTSLMKSMNYSLFDEVKLAEKFVGKFPKFDNELYEKIKNAPHLTGEMSNNKIIFDNILAGIKSAEGKEILNVLKMISKTHSMQEALKIWNSTNNDFSEGINKYNSGDNEQLVKRITEKLMV